MDSRVRRALETGHGLVTAGELAALGIDPGVVGRWRRAGGLVVVRRGVYATKERWEEWDDYVEKPLARIRAADRAMRDRYVFSHDSAALLDGVRLIRPQESEIHVTRPELRASLTRFGTHHHAAGFEPSRVVEERGLLALDVARTVIDLACYHGYRAGLVAADGALHAGVRRAELAAVAEAMAHRPGIRTARAVVRDCRLGAESVAETLAWELCVEAGLTPDEPQFPVQTRRGLVWADMRIGRHLVETDGFLKLLPVAEGGVATRPAAEVLWEERGRELDVCAEGLGMTRLRWRDYWGAPRAAAIERLHRENAVTERRFGRALSPELEETARRWRGRRFPYPE
jgi:hypothetical protein